MMENIMKFQLCCDTICKAILRLEDIVWHIRYGGEPQSSQMNRIQNIRKDERVFPLLWHSVLHLLPFVAAYAEKDVFSYPSYRHIYVTPYSVLYFRFSSALRTFFVSVGNVLYCFFCIVAQPAYIVLVYVVYSWTYCTTET
jgi:hypothetical protein